MTVKMTTLQASQNAQPVVLTDALSGEPQLEFAVLIGSRAVDTAHSDGDWDIALQWRGDLDWLDVLANTETLRRKLAKTMTTTIDKIDLIELRRANLTIRANVAENGVPLMGEDSLAWGHFLKRTWRELEDFYWELSHAA